jgi:hypothetical protein
VSPSEVSNGVRRADFVEACLRDADPRSAVITEFRTNRYDEPAVCALQHPTFRRDRAVLPNSQP